MSTPFTILTGFLGAGKTTVLNRVLSTPQGMRVAVLVNELGRVSIDSQLIVSRGGDVLELAGGCVCCKIDVKNDLWDGILDVIRRSQPDAVVLETTGIAEPGAILEGIERLPEGDREAIRPAGVVCVVDGQAGAPQIDRREEAVEQVAAADRLLLSKLDVAAPETVRALHRRLTEINDRAEVASFPDSDAGRVALVHWLLEERALSAPARPHRHAHRQGQLTAATFSATEPLLEEPLLALLDELGDRLFRVKGTVDVAGRAGPSFLEKAGVRTELRACGSWPQGAPRRTELVLIGEIDEAAIRRRLWACRAGAPVTEGL
jgi:G3E family GTPase